MRTSAAACLAVLVAGCQPALPTAPRADEVTVSHVADGDTFSGLNAAGERVTVRLLGIDAPELAHDGTPAECGAKDARSALQRLVLHHRVSLASDPKADRVDRYGRRLAYADLAGVDVARHQLAAGYAAAWYPRSEPRPARHASYLDAEQLARTAHAGAWANCPRLGR